jgi:hypothetical protein
MQRMPYAVELLADGPDRIGPTLWHVQPDDAKTEGVAELEDVEAAGAIAVPKAGPLAAHVLECRHSLPLDIRTPGG